MERSSVATIVVNNSTTIIVVITTIEAEAVLANGTIVEIMVVISSAGISYNDVVMVEIPLELDDLLIINVVATTIVIINEIMVGTAYNDGTVDVNKNTRIRQIVINVVVVVS